MGFPFLSTTVPFIVRHFGSLFWLCAMESAPARTTAATGTRINRILNAALLQELETLSMGDYTQRDLRCRISVGGLLSQL